MIWRRARQWEENRNFGAASRRAVYDYLSTEVRHDSPAFRQPEAQATARFATTEKRIKHVTPHFSGNSWSVVAHDDLSPRLVAGAPSTDRDRYMSAFVDCFDRIFNDGVQ